MFSHPDRKPTTDQSNNIAKVQLHEPMNLLGLMTGTWVRDTYRNRDISGSCVTESSEEADTLERPTDWQVRKFLLSRHYSLHMLGWKRPCESAKF